MDGSAGPSTSDQSPHKGKGPGSKSHSPLNVIEAPETQRFNSPLPASGSDTRKPATKLGKFHDMTAKGAIPTKRPVEMVEMNELDDDDDDEEDGGGGGAKRKFSNKRNATSTGRRKIDIEYIDDKSKRHVSFTKRKAGLMKKAYELSTLTGTNCLVLVVSETGLVYTYATPGLKPVIASEDGKAVIAASLRGELKADDGEEAAAPPKSRKSKAKSASTESEDDEDKPMKGEEFSNGDQPQEHHQLASGYEDLSHLPHHHHPMFGGDHIMDPSLRYLGDFNNLFPPASASPAAPPLTLPPLPYSVVAEATQHPYTLPPYRPSMPAEASTSQQPMHEQPTHQPQAHAGFVPSPPPPQTAFDRAAAEHAQAFASYQAKTVTPYLGGRPAPSAASQVGGGSHGQPLHGAHEFGDAARNWLPNLIKEKEAPIVSGPTAEEGMEERRKAWREEAAQALQEAARNRTIKTFIAAHSLSHKANLAIPPPRNTVSKPTGGIELTLEHFRNMCESSNIEGLAYLGPASKAFMDAYLPDTLHYTPKMLNEAQQHLCLFYDYLESHDLISAKEYAALSSFDSLSTPILLPPSTSTNAPQPVWPSASALPRDPGAFEEVPARVRNLKEQLQNWAEECCLTFQSAGRFAEEDLSLGAEGVAGVEGWFEVYRVRKSFALLKERELQGDSASNFVLSPFKVRMPSRVTNLLQIEDTLWLKLKRVVARPGSAKSSTISWAPVQSGPIHPSTASSPAAESDIDTDSFGAELDSMLLAKTEMERTTEDDLRIREHREVLDMLKRAKERLAEGELSD